MSKAMKVLLVVVVLAPFIIAAPELSGIFVGICFIIYHMFKGIKEHLELAMKELEAEETG